MRESMRRWHLWLGWIVGAPLMLWTISGLVMVSRPIAETRSEHVLRPASPVRAGALVAPSMDGKAIRSVSLVDGPAGPRWRIGLADGNARAADAHTGMALDRLSAAQATAAALARYTGSAPVEAVNFIPHGKGPREFNRPVDAWQVVLDDGMHLYVDAWGGEVLVARSSWWRLYDVFWGLHIMDLQGRDNPNNPWVVTFSLLAVFSIALAIGLLPRSTRRMLGSSKQAEQGD